MGHPDTARRLIPTDDHILLEEVVVDEGKIHLLTPVVDPAVKKLATVLAVGPGVTLQNGQRQPMPCKPGDTVLVNAGAGFKAKVDGVEHWFVYGSHRDVIAVVG